MCHTERLLSVWSENWVLWRSFKLLFKAILENPNCTVGFDATTQEGVHINSIHITTKSDCVAIAVDELPGGTAHDYHTHICESIDNLANVHSQFNGGDCGETKKKLIQNILNTLTDRCAANHATVQLLNETWEKELTELNCHLHPLDSISHETREALKNFEKEKELASQIWGNDCTAGDIVLQLNKMRFKDGKGDPRGFKAFLDREGLPRGILPQYRGNRLHVLFHIAGILVCYHDLFIKYLEKGTTSGGLRKKLCTDLKAPHAHVELQVLGLIGKLLSGPWMRKFYTSSEKEINHVEGIELVKDIVSVLKEKKESTAGVLSSTCDFFGTRLDPEKDLVLKKLQEEPKDGLLFQEMMKLCLQSVIDVLERQYEKYFQCDLTAKLRAETESARSHNIDAEEIMGMFSALQKRAPNATICYLSCKMRAQKNRSVDYLDGMNEERRDAILKKAVQLGQKQRRKRRMKQKELRDELMRREEAKNQARDLTERNRVEKRLKKTSVDKLAEEFPEVTGQKLDQLKQLFAGEAVGQTMVHGWYDEEQQKVEMYNGKIEELFVLRGIRRYSVAYWLDSESYDDAEDITMTVTALCTDFIAGDIVM